MTTIDDLKYSKRLGEISSYVFIDGVCVKSRREAKPTIQEALESNKSVLVQTKGKVKIYVNNEDLDYYKSWIKNMSSNVKKGRNMYGPLMQAFLCKDILVITDEYKNGYEFSV